MNVLISFFIFLLVLFVYIHVNFHIKSSNELEIFDLDEISKEQLEDVTNYKQPVLFKYNCQELDEHLQIERIVNEYANFDLNVRKVSEYSNDDNILLPMTLTKTSKLRANLV